jgi:hypothetical protein
VTKLANRLRRSRFPSSPVCERTRKGKSDGEFQLVPFIVGQVDDHGVFIKASELRRVIVGIAEYWMKEHFACALNDDGFAGVQLTSTVSGETL